VYLVAKASGLTDGSVAFPREQVQDRGLVLRRDLRQGRRFLTDHERDGPCIKPVGLARLTSSTPALSSPARIDFVDDFLQSDQVLGKSSSVSPCAFDTPLSVRRYGAGPLLKVAPASSAVLALPLANLPARFVQRERYVQPFVCVNPDGDHSALLEMIDRLARGADELL